LALCIASNAKTNASYLGLLSITLKILLTILLLVKDSPKSELTSNDYIFFQWFHDISFKDFKFDFKIHDLGSLDLVIALKPIE
jgi:hypothetical protein